MTRVAKPRKRERERVKTDYCDYVTQIRLPSDLKNVCLVNKQLHEIAVRFLYRNIALDLGSPKDARLSAFLNPRNIGLKHIRQLRLYLAQVNDRCNQELLAHFATRMLLEFLPANVLEEFSWCPWKSFSADNLMLLYKNQRKLKWLEIMDLDVDVLPELKKNDRLQASIFRHARKLALYPENRETLNLCGFFVEKTGEAVEELIVHCNFTTDHGENPTPRTVDSRELNDSPANGPGLLTRTIFGHMMPFDTCTPFTNLTSLRLHRVNLRHCVDTWCKFINFHHIQFLRLYHCVGADTLLAQMSQSAHLPKQLKVLEFQHRDNSENEALIALDGFLCLVFGIRELAIDMEKVNSLPVAAGIVKHAKTLELLNVHCAPKSSISVDNDWTELVYEVDDFLKICKACSHLEQLSCAWPPTSLIRRRSAEWNAFAIACLFMRNLITLHITTFPSNKPSAQLLPTQQYDLLLQDLAQHIFECATENISHSMTPISLPPYLLDDPFAHLSAPVGADDLPTEGIDAIVPPFAPSKLRIVAFGVSDKIYERQDSDNMIIFFRSTCYDARDKPQIYASRIGWCLRQYIEPRSEVLDFVLHRSNSGCRPPSRDQDWGEDDEDE